MIMGLQTAMSNTTVKIKCSNYPKAIRSECNEGKLDPSNGMYYNLNEQRACDWLPGDFQNACYNEVQDILKCSDYPGEIEMLCESGQFNKDNGKFYNFDIEPVCNLLNKKLKKVCLSNDNRRVIDDDDVGDL